LNGEAEAIGKTNTMSPILPLDALAGVTQVVVVLFTLGALLMQWLFMGRG
jgi:hypothetical protein